MQVYNIWCKIFIVKCKVNCIEFILYSVQCKCTMYTMYSVQGTGHNVQCKLTVYIVYFTV